MNTTLKPPQWRILNLLDFDRDVNRRWPAGTVLTGQGATRDDLGTLEAAALVECDVAGTPIILTVHLGAGRITPAIGVRITLKGHQFAVDHPHNRVIYMLARYAGAKAAVQAVRPMADVDDTILRAMEAKGLVVAHGQTGDLVAMDTFRRLPPDLMIHLTKRGRTWLPASGSSSH